MKIENLKSGKTGNRARVSAKITWEDCDRPSQEIYFETTETFAEDLTCNPHAFLLGCILPANHHGEKRICVDAEICPELRDGIMTALNWIRHWSYKPETELIRIESKTRSHKLKARLGHRAGVFFSGGIDGLATIRLNRINFPMHHPGSIKDALIMFGPYWESNNQAETFEQALTDLSEFAEDAAIELIPVYTNVRDIDRDTMLFIYEYHGAMLASVAHAFAPRFSSVTIAATDDIPSLALIGKKNFRILGSHPLLDTNYSSSDLQIKHGDITLTRFEKTKLIADWGVALNCIKVCQPNWPGANCGKCEKCVRTELALLAANMLDKTKAFPLEDVNSEHIDRIKLGSNPEERWTAHHQYLELIPIFEEKGRNDLVRAIQKKIADHKRGEKRNGYRNSFIDPIVKFDEELLGGTLRKIKRMIYSKGIWN
jgi:hypothetical protein